jgi:molecular chaperone GrpE
MSFPLVLRRELEDSQLRLQTLTQEFTHYRRRTSDTQAASYQQGKADAALAFLPVYDNLLRALDQPCEDEAFVTGIRMTLKSLLGVLTSLGISEIPALGETFDPQVHEALEHITDPTVGENTVTSVALTGFRQGDTVLRHALVVVAN